MLSNIKLTELNNHFYSICNLRNASFGDSKNKLSSFLAMTNKKLCISTSLKHALRGAEKNNAAKETILRDAMSNLALIANPKGTEICGVDIVGNKCCINTSLKGTKPSYKYKGNCGLLKENSSVSTKDIQIVKGLRVL